MQHCHIVKYSFALGTALILSLFISCSSRKGCIDPGSVSFDPEAKIDNGKCAYPEYSIKPLLFRKLDNAFSETSGLTYRDNRLWTIIDELGENKIYSIDLVNGNKKEVIEATGVSSLDFEAVTSSPTHFFIADIGNNEGNRTDLTIYKIPKPSTYTAITATTFERIRFSYPEQTDFRKNSNSNYDAEALMYFNDKLYIFTKNNTDNEVALYELPVEAGDHKAKIRGVFDTKGLVTDAAMSPSGKQMVMVGYNKSNGKAFLWVLRDFQGAAFFSGKKTLVDIGTMNTTGQVEGVVFHNENNIFISNEQFEAVNANLYYLDISNVQ